MGFYTTTDLLTGDIEGGSITSSTSQASAPRFAVSLLVTAPLKRASKRAWIAAVISCVLACLAALQRTLPGQRDGVAVTMMPLKRWRILTRHIQ